MSSFELSEREERFCLWLATPRGKRNPATMQDLADSMDVNLSTLYRWRKRKNVRERVMDLIDDAVGGFERVQQVLDKIFDDALNGATAGERARAQQMVLKYAGMLTDRQEREVRLTEASDLSEASDEDLEREAERLRSKRENN